MKLRRRFYVLAGAGLALLGLVIAGLWLRHTPEPRYQGIQFGVFLDEHGRNWEMRRTGWQAAREMSNSVVPYLVSQIEHDPLRELMFKIKPSMPAKIRSVLPDPMAYASRRSRAAGLLPEAGTNAVRALPVLLEIAEAEGPQFTHNFIRAIGMLAPGTEYEDRARKVILRVVSEARSDRDSELRRMSYHFLGSFDGNEVVVALIDGLRERRMTGACIESLVKIGTNALPELTKAAAHESRYVRPAGLALEKIERKLREDQGRIM